VKRANARGFCDGLYLHRKTLVVKTQAKVVARTVKIQHAGWLSGTKANGEPRKDTPMRVLRDPYPPGVGESALAEYPAGWLERYKENWYILGAIHRGT
jgi:hypothetical protein